MCRDWLFLYYDAIEMVGGGSACYLDGKKQQAKDESSATLTAKAVYGKTALIRTRRQMHVKK
jgi:hypothetical protein